MKCPRCHYTHTHEQEYCAACGHEMPKPIPSCDREKCEEMGVIIPDDCKQYACGMYVDYLEKENERLRKLLK